jgi:CheY-like chemotaxis protein
MLGEIRDAGERAATLTSQLLALGRRQVLAPAPLDLNELVSGVDKILRRLIGEDIHIVVQLTEGLGKVFADRGQLEQVLLNLALNARDAMPTGGTITIRTHVQVVDARLASIYPGVTPGRHAALSVGDTGAGIDDETRSRIFEPFFTTKGVGKGTGLGLAIVYGIVRQSGGFIEVESGGVRGTVFTVCLPICEEAAPRPERTARANPASVGHETVLLVEDEARIRRLCRQVLAEQGYHVIEAGDGLEAVALCAAEDRPVDLLVTDVVMPHMNGRELADRLRESHPDMKVLYISGYTDDAIVRRGVSQGSSALLSKPFTPHVLLRRVREVLDHSPE